MKKIVFNPAYIIGVFFFFFAISAADLLLHNPDTIYNWWYVLHWWGKIAVVLMVMDALWLIVSTLIKNRP